MSGHHLGIDYGTSHTVAVLRWPDGRCRPLLFDGSPLVPSALFLGPDGELVAGRDAVHSARLAPERFAPHPKRHVDEGVLLLGDRSVPLVDAVAATLARVAVEAVRAGSPLAEDLGQDPRWRMDLGALVIDDLDRLSESPVTDLRPLAQALAHYRAASGAGLP